MRFNAKAAKRRSKYWSTIKNLTHYINVYKSFRKTIRKVKTACKSGATYCNVEYFSDMDEVILMLRKLGYKVEVMPKALSTYPVEISWDAEDQIKEKIVKQEGNHFLIISKDKAKLKRLYESYKDMDIFNVSYCEYDLYSTYSGNISASFFDVWKKRWLEGGIIGNEFSDVFYHIRQNDYIDRVTVTGFRSIAKKMVNAVNGFEITDNNITLEMKVILTEWFKVIRDNEM